MGVHLSVENAINFYIIAAGIGVCGMCFLNIMRAPIRNLFRKLMFVTVWLGILKISTGILRAVNAGHEYPILKKPGGEYTVYKDRHLFKCGLNKRGAGT